ncbi:MAG: hypothetical protein QNL10_04985 [Crocinitomicaceae bacterium]|tara:strand:+ start:2014 stop:2637 length:624 start_codon:yes stop_codon:yes gene_type:complete
MDILRLTFQLGVFFAIYSFIWFFIDLGIKIMISGSVRGLIQTYLLKGVKYLFLVNVIFLFSIAENQVSIKDSSMFPVVVILVLYFVGKFQKNQNTNALFSRMGMQSKVIQFNAKYEIIVISFSILAFIGFIIEPSYALNPVSLWFKESIIDIASTALIGFIFKIIGLFFLLGLLTKTVNAFQFLLGKLVPSDNGPKQDQFDDFEEVE